MTLFQVPDNMALSLPTQNISTHNMDWRRFPKYAVDFNVARDILQRSMDRMLTTSERATLRKYLPRYLYVYLKDRRTAFGGTLLDVARVGLSYFEANIPAISTDQFCYETFQELLEPIVRKFHPPTRGFHPWSNWGAWRTLGDLDPDGKYIVSCCARCSRNMDGYRFTPTMNPFELDTVEMAIVKALGQLPEEFKGRYVQVGIIESNVSRNLDLNSDMFVEDPRIQTPNITSHWPRGRGIFGTPDGNFVALVNEKDHLCLVSFENSGKLDLVYRRLALCMPMLDRKLRTVRNPRLGFLTVSPALLGNTLRLFVNITLAYAPTKELLLLAERQGLVVLKNNKGSARNYYIFNMTEIGGSEFKQAEKFSKSIREIIQLDKWYAFDIGKFGVNPLNSTKSKKKKRRGTSLKESGNVSLRGREGKVKRRQTLSGRGARSESSTYVKETNPSTR